MAISMQNHENKTRKKREYILKILHIYRRISTILTSYERRVTDWHTDIVQLKMNYVRGLLKVVKEKSTYQTQYEMNIMNLY